MATTQNKTATAFSGDLKNYGTTQQLPNSSGGTVTGATAAKKSTLPQTLEDQYKRRKQESQAQINGIYDKQLASKQQELKTAYDRNLSDKQAAMDQIAPQYQNQANALAVQYEKNRRNANMNALQSGLNTGTAQQQQNALNHNYIGNYTGLRDQEAAAMTDARRGITDLKQAYRNNMNQVRADVDSKRNAALIEDQQKNQNWYDTQAATLAQYGDFSGYKRLYGTKQANAMRNMWLAQNPVQAFRMGLMDRDQFKKITGKEIEEAGFGDTYTGLYDEFVK